MQVKSQKVGPFTKLTFTKVLVEKQIRSSLSVHLLGTTLFDSGSEPAANFFAKALHSNPPKRIILSHQHEDHIGGLHTLHKYFGNIPVYCPNEHTKLVATGFVVPGHRISYWGNVKGFPDLIPYTSADTFKEGKYNIKVIDTPGHTVGHKAFVVQAKQELYIISGDLYLAAKLPHALFESSIPDMIASLETLASFSKQDILFPSHGRFYPNASLRLQKLADWYKSESEAIHSISEKLATTDYNKIFRHRYSYYSPTEIFTNGENSRCALIRGILQPVKQLPAETIHLDPTLLKESKEFHTKQK
ncbi:MAG: MBL fold metallo-hydrolase [Spirochaetota bacterium]